MTDLDLDAIEASHPDEPGINPFVRPLVAALREARAAIAAVREACVGVEDCDYATIVVANVLATLDAHHDPSATTEGGAS